MYTPVFIFVFVRVCMSPIAFERSRKGGRLTRSVVNDTIVAIISGRIMLLRKREQRSVGDDEKKVNRETGIGGGARDMEREGKQVREREKEERDGEGTETESAHEEEESNPDEEKDPWRHEG